MFSYRPLGPSQSNWIYDKIKVAFTPDSPLDLLRMGTKLAELFLFLACAVCINIFATSSALRLWWCCGEAALLCAVGHT